MTIQDDVRGFIVDTFFVADPAELTDDLSLIDRGIVDSTGMLDIILFLEERYAIDVLDHETTPANLETIGRIAAYVQRKRSQPTAAS
jgi:acyl carrier protein